MNLPYPNFSKAERAYLTVPDEVKPEFTERDILEFIRDLATCGTNPRQWLFDEGVKGEWDLPYNDDVAEMLQSIAISCVAGHHLERGEDKFWQVMKRMASDRFDYQQENAN
jgi:hypothetical protein